MSDQNRSTPEQPQRKATRDARGRWKTGHCPNPKGRPPKKTFKDYSPSDVRHFANTQIELTINGRPEKMDRRAALLSKVFESAMSGKVSQQRFLIGLFEKSDVQLAELRHHYGKLMSTWIMDNPDFKNFDESLTSEQKNELISLASVLNHYHPGQYTELLRTCDDITDADVAEYVQQQTAK